MLTKFTIDADYQIVAVSRSRTIERQRGFVLIVTSIAMTLLLGLAGLRDRHWAHVRDPRRIAIVHRRRRFERRTRI